MTDDSPLLGEEVDNHKTNLNEWVSKVSGLNVTDSRKGVHDRFVRDCQTLVTDLDNTESPSAADLVDFEDRHNSLEVQYHQLTDSTSLSGE